MKGYDADVHDFYNGYPSVKISKINKITLFFHLFTQFIYHLCTKQHN
jgi:hypothetical protein